MKLIFTKGNMFIMVITAVILTCCALLATSIVQKKYETKLLITPSVKLELGETRNSEWAKAYPHQWHSYLKPTEKSSLSSALMDELEHNPSLVVLWAGYGFAKDYNRPRGHPYAVVDTVNSLRTGAPVDELSGPMPATCMTCKSPDVPRLMSKNGINDFYKGKWARHVKETPNPIGCADCHNSQTMQLEITRPALVEAYKRQGKDISKASHQEMRSLVCAQCHVEYYFKEPGAYLTFPWDKGTTAEAIEAYYDAADFKDWTHNVSKAPMLKAQHPGYELFSHGIHGKRQVACADCHMPYKTVGGTKFSDHHVQSPLANISGACGQCHRVAESELLANVMDLKAKVMSLKTTAEEELVAAHFEAQKAWELGVEAEKMTEPLRLIRHGQWRWDFATAAHGSYFHAPEEVLRLLGSAIQKTGTARRKLATLIFAHGYKQEVVIPEISSKEKAQVLIGLDHGRLVEDKVRFVNDLVGPWWQHSPVRDDVFMDVITKELRK